MRRIFVVTFLVLVPVSMVACAHGSDGDRGAAETGGMSAGPSDEGANCLIAKFQNAPTAPQQCTAQCEKGDAESCTTVGAMYEQGHLVAADREKAVKAYARGCELGDRMGCSDLGKITKDSDPKAALAAFERVCTSKEDKAYRQAIGEACAFTGSAYAEGKVVTRNEKRATDDLAKACRLGHIASCDRLDFKPKR